MIYSVAVLGLLATAAQGKTYFKEDFNDKAWESRWTTSVFPGKSSSDMGSFKWTSGEHFLDASDKGIQTSEDAKFYGISAKLSEAFTNKDKDIVVQFSVKHEQELDCGGAYLKLTGDIEQDSFSGDSPYQIMFGPDICGPSNQKTHVIFHYPPKKDNLLIKNDVSVKTDSKVSHLYTLHVKKDSSFEVFIDQESVREGKLESEFDFLLPKEIKDPAQSKPKDWVDDAQMPDPADKKPAGWDDIPAEIPDPDASKPDDWDDEEDGTWEAPLIDNPEYKGVWKPKMIDNPAYKGEWVHPMIPNPDYKEDKELYLRADKVTHVGFELWQVKSGTIFDDILVTDSLDEAKKYGEEVWKKKQAAEQKAADAAKAEKEKADAAAADSSSSGDDEKDEGNDEL